MLGDVKRREEGGEYESKVQVGRREQQSLLVVASLADSEARPSDPATAKSPRSRVESELLRFRLLLLFLPI